MPSSSMGARRGKVVVDNYKFVGQNGHGQYVPRKNPGHL